MSEDAQPAVLSERSGAVAWIWQMIVWPALPEKLQREHRDLTLPDVLRIQHLLGQKPREAGAARRQVLHGVPVDRARFDELLALQLGMVGRRRQRGTAPARRLAVADAADAALRSGLEAALSAAVGRPVRLTDDQVALYREFREATNRSLDTMARADMLRFAGDDVKGLRAMVMDAPDAQARTMTRS